MAEAPGTSRPRLRFGDFVLDPEAMSLEGPEGRIPVEPRVLDVLHRVLSAEGELVTKDELAESVWREEIPSDAAIGRAVHHARKALGESGRDAEILLTVHGRGFRAGVPVERLGPATSAPAGPSATAPPAGDEPRETPRRVLVLAAAVAGLLVVGAAAWWLRPGPTEIPPVERMTRIAIVPPGEEVLDAALCELLSLHLERLPGVLVRDCELGRRAGLAAPSLAQIADLAGVDLVVSGGRDGEPGGTSRLALTLSGVAPDGAVERFELPTVSVRESDPRSLRRAAHDLASRIGAVIGAEPGAGPAVALPEDPVALAGAIHGLRALHRGGCGDPLALDLLEEAVREEPGFSRAWLGLAEAHRRRASDCGFHHRHVDAALRALDRATETGGPDVRGEALRVRVLVESGQLLSAREALRAAEERGADPRLDWEASRLLIYAGFPELAMRRLERARRGDPGLDLATTEPALAEAFLPGGDPQTIERLVPSPRHFFDTGLARFEAGERDAALRALRPAFRADPGDQFGRLAEALGALAEGSAPDARRILSELGRDRAATGSGDPLIDHRLAELFARAGSPTESLTSLARAIDGGFHCAPCLRSPAWETVRTDSRFPDAVARASRTSHELGRALGLPLDGAVKNP